jgi:hypothetical protein
MADDFEEDLGPQTFGEELFRDLVKESGESLAEDGSGRKVRVPKGTSPSVFLAVLAYAAAKKITDIGPLVALGANPFHGAKLLARGMFIGLAALLQNNRLPGVFRYLLQSFGSLGEGYLDGTIDKARRSVLEQLTKWSALSDPESAMGPSLRIAQGIIEFNKDKIMGKASGLPGQSASTDGASNKNTNDKNKGGNAGNVAAPLPGMGTEMFIKEYFESLEKKAGTDPAALAKVEFMRGALAAYQSSAPADAAYLIDASTRGLIAPEEIARALALLDTDFVPSGKKDTAGSEIFISAREARLNDIVREARKRVDEAKKVADPKPADPTKKNPDDPPPGAIGPKKIPIGRHGFIDNPTWGDQSVDDSPDPGKLREGRVREEWLKKMGPPKAPRAPRAPINWNVRGRAATVWSHRNRLRILATPFLWVWGKILLLWAAVKARWAARNTPPTPPTPPAPPSP